VRRIAWIAASFAAAGIVTQGAAVQPQSSPQFRSTTTYVVLDVVVTDRDDRVITDLTKDDFRITERGRPQAIADFTFVSIPPANRVVDLDAPLLAPPTIRRSAGLSGRATRA
jgi:hypothetical protein